MQIKCDKCSTVHDTVSPETAKDGDIEHTFFRCLDCGSVYCNETGDSEFATAFNGDTADVAFISDRDGYICFSTNSNFTTRYQIYHSDTVRDIYGLISSAEENIAGHREELDVLKILPENLLIEQGKNLFDKNAVIEGYYLSSEGGGLSYHETSAVSPLIPVEPGKIYTVNRMEGNLTTSELAYVAADGKTRLRPLNLDGTERNNYMGAREFFTMAPEGAAYCQFTVKFKGNSADYDKVQFEEGPEATDYVPYLHRLYIGYNLLPTELNGLAEKTDELEKKTDQAVSGQ